jgi:hypothetical protein
VHESAVAAVACAGDAMLGFHWLRWKHDAVGAVSILSPDVGSSIQGGGEPKSTGRNPALVLTVPTTG